MPDDASAPEPRTDSPLPSVHERLRAFAERTARFMVNHPELMGDHRLPQGPVTFRFHDLTLGTEYEFLVSPSESRTAATNGRALEAPAELTPPARALAAAYDLQREGKPISLKAACDIARVDRANLRKNYPEAVATIKRLAVSNRSLRSGVRDRRAGSVDAIEDDEDQDED